MSSSPRSPLLEQVEAVERAASNLDGHVKNLRDLVGRGRRPVHELEISEAWLPALKAAGLTMRGLLVADEGTP